MRFTARSHDWAILYVVLSLLFSVLCLITTHIFLGVSAELVRTDLRDGEEGIPYFSEYQIIDVTTCDPIPNIYVDTWHGQ